MKGHETAPTDKEQLWLTKTNTSFSSRACMPSMSHRDMILGRGGLADSHWSPLCCWEFGPCAVHPGMSRVELVLEVSGLRLDGYWKGKESTTDTWWNRSTSACLQPLSVTVLGEGQVGGCVWRGAVGFILLFKPTTLPYLFVPSVRPPIAEPLVLHLRKFLDTGGEAGLEKKHLFIWLR